jgi:hypothetical protein
MKKWYLKVWPLIVLLVAAGPVFSQTVIRFNRFGFEPRDIKMLVVASKDPAFRFEKYRLVNAITTGRVNSRSTTAAKDFGRFGPFVHSFRVDISSVRTPGKFLLVVNDSIWSDTIKIALDVYHGTAESALGFLREQRCGNEPSSFDSAHQTNDFISGGSRGDSVPLNLAGGWHNVANDRQEIEAGATITGYMLAAYRKFPFVFNDNYDSWGKPGKNGRADVMDEGKWGLDWLLKMHPSKDRLFRQLGNDINQFLPPASMRKVDGRPAYLLKDSAGNEENIIEATSLLSTVFANGFKAFNDNDPLYATRLKERALNTYEWANRYSWKLGSAHRAYAGLVSASSALGAITNDKKYNSASVVFENKTMYTDSVIAGTNFVFVNDGLACQDKKAILQKWKKQASMNAFNYGGSFNANSNYQAVLMSVEAMHYRTGCNDTSFLELEQAGLDWLLGNNPWGIVMLSKMNINGSVNQPYPPASLHHAEGGLVNGPVSESIYKRSAGSSLLQKDNLETWQSSMAVYHDDAADYTTNMPQAEATAAMMYLLASRENASLGHAPNGIHIQDGAVLRGDSSSKKIALVFIGMPPAKGAKGIGQILAREKIRSSFFLPVEFLKQNAAIAKQLKAGRHYMGAAGSMEWWNSGSGVSPDQKAFDYTMQENRRLLKTIGINPVIRLSPDKKLNYLYNCDGDGKTYLLNPTPGTLSLAVNILPGETNYVNSDSIFQDIMAKARQMPYGLNGYFLVIPTDPPAERADKFYMLIPLLLQDLKNEGYRFVRVDEMLGLAVPKPEPAPRKKAAVKKKKKRRR